MRVLIVTAMYPSTDNPARGTFVKEQVDSLRQAGVEVDVVVFEGRDGRLSYLRAARTMQRQLQAKQYDIVHAHYGLTGAVARMQVECPVIVTFHGSDLLGRYDPRNPRTLKSAAAVLISKLAAIGATKRIIVAEVLRPKLWPLDAITIPMGVDLSTFKPTLLREARTCLGLPQNRYLVLFVAAPGNSLKRYDVAQAAVRLLREATLDVELIALHDTPHDQVPLYMNACDALVLTSMYEASPCVIKEAMACNLPIVSTNVGDVAERINGIEGCYLCERTPEDVSAKLGMVVKNGRRTNGREKVQSLSLPSIAQRVIAVYKEALSN